MHLVCDTLPQAEGGGGRIERRLAIIGVGQRLRGDDAAGLEAVRRWTYDHSDTAERADIRVENLEVPGPSLLDALHEVDAAIIVDAVQAGKRPGSIHDLSPHELEAFGAGAKSAHGWGVAETLRLGGAVDAQIRAVEVRIVGIEAAHFNMGKGLSPEVKQALPEASAAIQQQVERLLAA